MDFLNVDIPGYKIQREIGQGRSSRVYLALQHAFGRPVAIKVLSPEVSRDRKRKASFLAKGKVARTLDHPNIVRVFDTGETEDAAYIVMEYVRGGDLNANLRDGLHMQNVLAVIKGVASALGHAHDKGIIHGDVKPGNVLIDETGTSLLSDFGVGLGAGTAVDSIQVGGTAGYTSPEQAAGREIDGRSDFFSLGAVFYLMLTGHLPFDPDSGGGSMRSRDGPPALPIQMAAVETVVQRLLARSPDGRFGSAVEIIDALDAVRTGDSVPNAVVKTAVVSTSEIAALATRTDRPGSVFPASRSSRLRRAGGAATVLGVLLLVGAAWYLGDESGALQRALAVAGLVEHPDVVVALQAADALRRDPTQNPDKVVEAYREVLAMDPARAEAQVALDELAREWKEEIGRQIDQGQFGTASQTLADWASTFPNDPDFTGLSDRLADRRQAVAMLEQSIRLLDSSGLGNVRAVNSAIDGLKEVLTLQPANPEALAKLDEVAIYYGEAARQHAGAGDGPDALDAILVAERANPAFEGVEDVRALVMAAVEKHDAAREWFDNRLQRAAALRESGALVDAIEMYRSVLVIEPDAAVALQGLAGTSSDVLAEFESLLNDDRLDEATALFEMARTAGIPDDAVEEMRAVRDAKMKRIADVARLIDEAESFLQEGYITGPDPANSAVARLREALRLDADNADGIRLQSMAATRLADVAVEAYYAGMAEEGLQYLDFALAVIPGAASWRSTRDEWQAEIWRERAAESEEPDGERIP